jgi:hypothetical protein
VKKIIRKGFPLYLLGVFLLAFGLQVPKLGFVLDDWAILYAHYAGGNQNLAQYAFLVNRPNLAWIWEAGIALIGYNAVRWQVLSLFFRYLAVLLTWLGWKQIWPNHKTEVSLAAGLFAVYPIFAQQAAAISFVVHWVCLSLYAGSILLMILAVKNRRFRIPLLIASLLLGASNIFSMEYFVGLELLRPVILWLLLANEQASRKLRIKKVLAIWSPFIAMGVIYLFYRFLWMPTPGYDRNTPALLTDLISSPLKTLTNFALGAVRDLIQAVFGSWSVTIQPGDINFDTPASIAALGVVAIVALLTAGTIFLQKKFENTAAQETTGRFYPSALLYGLLAIAFGLLPVWAIDQGITSASQYSDRFSLPILAGAGLVVVGLLDWFSQNQAPKIAAVCVLIGLGAGFQFRQESVNRYSWEAQLNTYWQLKWRIPGMIAPTALYGDGVLGKYMGGWADNAAYNTLYPARSADGFDGTWYFNLFKSLGDAIKPNTELNYKEMEDLRFAGNSSNSLVLQKQGAPGQCVWLVTTADRDNPYISDSVKPALSLTNLDRVIGNIPSTLPQDIFGPEIAHTWCYYFEKADLAKQNKQWDEIVRLWNEAQEKKARPNVPVEYVPFIQGAAHTGNWDLALEITNLADDPKDINGNYLCSIWKDLLTDAGGDATVAARAQGLLECTLTK